MTPDEFAALFLRLQRTLGPWEHSPRMECFYRRNIAGSVVSGIATREEDKVERDIEYLKQGYHLLDHLDCLLDHVEKAKS